MAPSFEFHIFICQNQRPEGSQRGCCLSKGSDTLLNYMKKRAKDLDIPNLRVNKSGCLDQCEKGPALVVYPEGIWYTVNTTEDIEEILQSHMLNKQPVERLKLV